MRTRVRDGERGVVHGGTYPQRVDPSEPKPLAEWTPDEVRALTLELGYDLTYLRLKTWAQVLWSQLKNTSTVPTPALGTETARPKPSSKPPTGDGDYMHDQLNADWNEAVGDWSDDTTGAIDVARMLIGWQARLDAIRYSPDVSLRRGTPEWKIAVATDARPSHVVGRVRGVSASYVRKLRQEFRAGKLKG